MEFKGTPDQWLDWLVGDDEQLAHDAKLALGGLIPEDNVPLEALINGLTSADTDVVFWSLAAMSRLGPRSAGSLDAICSLALRHHAYGVRQMAVTTLSKIAPESAGAKAAVLRAFTDTDPFVRRDALQAMIRFPNLTDDELRMIENMERDEDPDVARWSEIALRNIRLDRSKDA